MGLRRPSHRRLDFVLVLLLALGLAAYLATRPEGRGSPPPVAPAPEQVVQAEPTPCDPVSTFQYTGLAPDKRTFLIQQMTLLREVFWASAAYHHVHGRLPESVDELDKLDLLLYGPGRTTGYADPLNGAWGWHAEIIEPEQTTGKFVNVRWQQSSESTSGAQPFLVVTPLEDVRRPNIVATFGTDRSLEHARRVVIDRTVLEMFEHHLALKRTLPADMRQLESTLGVYRRRRWAGGPGEPVVVLLNRAENTVVAPSGSLQYVDGETPCFRTLPDPGAVTGATETFQVGTF